MKLPQPERAVVEIAKLRDYCLSAGGTKGTHPAPRKLGRGGIKVAHYGNLSSESCGSESRLVELGQQPEPSLASSASNPAGEA